MGFVALIYSVGFFWIILHALRYVLARRNLKANTGILPVSRSSRNDERLWLNTKVVLKQAYLRIESTGYNDAHDRLIALLAKQAHARTRRALFILYDLGRLSSLIGILLVISLLLWSITSSAVNVLGSTAEVAAAEVPSGTRTFSKRFEGSSEAAQPSIHGSSAQNAPLHLIIPGVTVPLSHLPLLLVALFVSQVVHEAGHAICSAMESVPLLSVGASLTTLIPSAFVSLSSAAVQSLSPRARMRIISAGPFHNLLHWVVLVLMLRTGIGPYFWYFLGYDYIGHFGRVVLETHPSSPLHRSLPDGIMIVALDDLQLTSSDSSMDLWTSYLSRTQISGARGDIGWCVDTEWFLSQNNACCATSHPGSDRACFVELDSELTEQVARCAPTLAILHSDPATVKRCTLTADCGDNRICVEPRDDEQLVRIGIWTTGFHDSAVQGYATDSNIVIWSGPKEEILEEVRVGTYLPRHSWLPLGPPEWMAIFMNYLVTLTLSLYLFNLLPLPLLDGSQLLDAFLDASSSQNIPMPRANISLLDMEAGSGFRTNDRIEGLSPLSRKRRLSRGVQILTGTLMLITILLRSLELS